MTNRTLIYFIEAPADRWFRGDHRWRSKLRRCIRGPDPIGGINRVFLNLCQGLEKLGAEYETNIPFSEIRSADKVGVIGRGVNCLDGYDRPNPILAGVAVAEHPAQWPTLFDDYPVAQYVVHSGWVKEMYERTYGNRIATWAVGIDTDYWVPTAHQKTTDFLIYDKLRWEHARMQRALVLPILKTLEKWGLTYETIRYGAYNLDDYRAALGRSRAMLFLCEHETQGLAYQEAMSCDVPILAWDPGQWLDPWRFRYGEGFVPASSVPFFDARCGSTFSSAVDFEIALEEFLMRQRSNGLTPRAYVLENLTLDRCAQQYLDLLDGVNR